MLNPSSHPVSFFNLENSGKYPRGRKVVCLASMARVLVSTNSRIIPGRRVTLPSRDSAGVYSQLSITHDQTTHFHDLPRALIHL
jgi:hypothetical protein